MSALTTVYLEGEMGALFGREWQISIRSPSDALSIIDANVGNLFLWIRRNLQKYQNYVVVCEHQNGTIEQLGSKEEYLMLHNLKSLRFVPLIAGASAVGKILVGVALLVASIWFPPLFAAGASMALGGVAELLAPKPKKSSNNNNGGPGSHYFNGAQNTVEQGAYVPLIYGRVKTGSQAVSVALTVAEEI